MKYKKPAPLFPKKILCPAHCAGIPQPVCCLDGSWQVRPGLTRKGEDGWLAATVPEDRTAAAGGCFGGQYTYRRRLDIPAEGAHHILKFEGVNGHAEVWVGEQKVATHDNGFITWYADISGAVSAGCPAMLYVAVDETVAGIGCFNHGGILHSVYLYALPERYVDGLSIVTQLQDNYKKACIHAKIHLSTGGGAGCVEVCILAPSDTPVAKTTLPVPTAQEGRVDIPLAAPLLWDAEHPNLYTLRLRLLDGETVQEEVTQPFGIREIRRVQNRVYVNGQEIKLRGVCRHETTPTQGRAVPRAWIDADIRLFKEANCNYIRTSHYPPSSYFLEQCDRVGLYVEDELDLAFIAKTTPYYQRDPALTAAFYSAFAEVLVRDAPHPSVLIWSIANEAFGGYNYDAINRLAHQVDPTRLTKFSYPMTMQREHEPTDIWSIHYANVEGQMEEKRDNLSVGLEEGYDYPILYDEYVHLPCYNREEIRRDPYVRSFWGRSVAQFYDKIWATPGALGGAIWAGIDETVLFYPANQKPATPARPGTTDFEWGLLDLWRRKKPEFFATRKAYTPVKIQAKTYTIGADCVAIPLENRFCHTNLCEVRVEWQYPGVGQGSAFGPDIPPAGTGVLELPLPVGGPGQPLLLQFYGPDGNMVDEYRLAAPATGPAPTQPGEQAGRRWKPLAVAKNAAGFAVTGEDFQYCFAADTGLLTLAEKAGEPVLIGGPFLHTERFLLGKWVLKSSKVEPQGENVVVELVGGYQGSLDVHFTLTICPDGTLTTTYKIEALYAPLPPEKKLRVGVDAGGLAELGVAYRAAPGFECLWWQREGQNATYSEEDIARTEGTARRYATPTPFAQPPHQPWKDETRNYLLNGRYDVDYKGTADFRALKENIRVARLYAPKRRAALAALANGDAHLRLLVEEPPALVITPRDAAVTKNGSWYCEADPGNHTGEEWLCCEAGGWMECTFAGTGVVWYGPVDTIYGIARVYLDDVLVDPGLDQKINGVDFPGSAAGYDKKYKYPVFSVQNLAPGTHRLRVEVTGQGVKDANNTYLAVDYFRVLDGTAPEPLRVLLLNDFNYPQISWGNFKKPGIYIYPGYQNQVTLRLEHRPDGQMADNTDETVALQKQP
ncbi:MAG: glycoside hydrolase family 2 TIM barrel-domain containing protein [Gemmiger sp.]|nr:glycoside hydrolase family 2 TIM barrel-domain containing protein [Gemmiger sp.]